jgi:hypothetical protein
MLERIKIRFTFLIAGIPVHEHADAPRPLALLRPRPARPRSRRAPEKRDELAALHSITSSARASKVAGTVRPSIRAVW